MHVVKPYPGAAIALIVIGVLLHLRARAELWSAAGSFLKDHLLLIVFVVPAVLLLAARLIVEWWVRKRSGPGPDFDDARWPWLLTYPGVSTAAGAVLGVGMVALTVMLDTAAGAAPALQPALRIEALKHGLGLVAAAGAVAAFLLALRRQQHLERAQAHTELDAAERRFTDLYTKAVEQLGSADAAVRLGGLYALERVAQSDVDQRQTIVNVLCAYLRMPFTPPAAELPEEPHSGLPLHRVEPAPEAGRDAKSELQVHLTAQRILITHLVWPYPEEFESDRYFQPDRRSSFWPDLDLDLTGATLIDWVLQNGRLRKAQFEQAVFVGHADFSKVVFAADARFGGATFRNGVRFDKAEFRGEALYGDAVFAETPTFTGARVEADGGRTYVWPPGWGSAPDNSSAKGWHVVPAAGPGPAAGPPAPAVRRGAKTMR